MSKGKRLSILTAAEIEELYSPPVFSESDQRFFFTLNDREFDEINRIRDRKHRVVAIVLLGYFKSKPIPLNPSFKSMQSDLAFVSKLYFKDLKYRRFSLKADQKSRLYERVLSLLGVSNWSDHEHHSLLTGHLLESANSWAAPRALFDSTTEYLSHNKIAIPAYSTLQKLISQVLIQHQNALHERVKAACPKGLKTMLSELLCGENAFTLQHLRQGARNFTGTELNC